MTLNEKIANDLKEAMKNKNKEALNTIRMLKSAVQMAKINLKHDLNDDEIVDVVSKQIKMRKESIKEFTAAKREDLAEQYQKEIDILNNYMPEQLSLDEAIKIIDSVFEKVKPTSQKQMGLVMKEVTPLLKGKFDMGEVSKIIKEKINNI